MRKFQGLSPKSLGLTVVGSLAILFIAKKRSIIGEDLDLLINELRTKVFALVIELLKS
ncbi:hypothetical protein [Thermococcus sp.]|uniref:hypothetical protein n=1 Tax=Thermococcus sp. TaxID=35749 RepID=UPI0026308C26|nr:hypothetical protein [Thermococcus sp.]